MSVDLSLIIPNECRSVKDKEHARQYFEASMERIAKYFHGTKEQFITDVEIIEEEEECFEITYGFEVPLLNISVYMHSGYWDIWPVSRYSQYFYPYSEDRFGKPRIWARNYCFNALLAFGRKDGWICDEYHSWNSSLDTDSTFEDWKIYENDTEDGTISEFNLMDFADVDPENQKWPDYQAKYHDDFKECHANLDVIKQMFPDYEILSMGYPLSEYALAAKEEGLYLLNMETGESLTDYPFTNCNANFNGAGVQLFRGKESAFFNCIGKQLTDYRVGDFSWEWDSRDCNYLGQIVTDKATGKRFLIDGTPMPDKTNKPMTDKDYIEYAKAIHEEVYAMSTPMIDGMAGKVLTRIRKEQKKLFKMPEAWTSVLSNIIDVVDVMSVHAHKGRIWSEMNKGLEKILDQYIIDRYNELEAKHHLMLKYRYVGKFSLTTEVKERIYARLGAHYDTQRMQNMLERYPDLKEV